jgi:hypothetical protein
MAAKWEKIQKKEAKKAEKMKMPQRVGFLRWFLDLHRCVVYQIVAGNLGYKLECKFLKFGGFKIVKIDKHWEFSWIF